MSVYNFKVVLLGQGCVGKTSLVLRYVSNVFNDSHQSTVQASFLKKQLYLEQNLVHLNIWDTAGQEKFHALGPIYYREANGALLVYDVTNPDSLRKVRDWVKELNKMLGVDNITLAIIGNKSDLLAAPTPTEQAKQAALAQQAAATSSQLIQEASQLAAELPNARHHLVSAKLNQGIGELFASLSLRMVELARRRASARYSSGSAGSRTLRPRTFRLTDGDSAAGEPAEGEGRVTVGARQAPAGPSTCRC